MDSNALFEDLIISYWPYLIGLLILGLVTQVLRSSSVKGWWGERQIRFALSQLNALRYQCFHDLYLPRPDAQGTTQIDHVVVSLNGIFVIETKNYSGWIFGTKTQKDWTQQIYKKKTPFKNPLHQNDLHLSALAAYLELPKDRFHSLVYFIGSTSFRTPMPDNVRASGLTRWIQSHQSPLLTHLEINRVVQTLCTLDQDTDRKAAKTAHLKAISARQNLRSV